MKCKLDALKEEDRFAMFREQLYTLLTKLQEHHSNADTQVMSSDNHDSASTGSSSTVGEIPSSHVRDSSDSTAHSLIGRDNKDNGSDDIDLNVVDEEKLAKAKRQMDLEFNKNRKKFGDEGFVYDIVVDFGNTSNDGGMGEWDSDSESGDEES